MYTSVIKWVPEISYKYFNVLNVAYMQAQVHLIQVKAN